MKKRVMLLMIACLLMLLSNCALGQVSMTATVGYDQTTLDGRWFPLEVQMKNDGEAIEGVLSVDLMQTRDEYDRYEYPVRLDAGEEAVVRFPISTLATQRMFSVSLYEGNERIAQTITSSSDAVDSSALLIGLLGGDEAFAKSLSIGSYNDVLNRDEAFAAIRIDEAFSRMSEKELDAFQLLIAQSINLDALSADAQKQLDAWIKNGGILIYGPNADGRWIRERSGTVFGEGTESTGLAKALLTYTGAAAEPSDAVSRIHPLQIVGSEALFDLNGHCLLTETAYGNGWILACGFDLGDKALRGHLQEDALLQRLLLASEQIPYDQLVNSNHRANYRYGSSLNEAQVISVGVSIWPVALLLTAYVLVTGVGLFALLRGKDQNRLLWIALPVTALAGVAIVAALAGMLELDAPTAASFHVTHYDENGVVSSEERALVAYPDQSRVILSAENGVDVERMEYGYFYGNAETEEITTHRDTVTLGEQPSLELSAVAPWLARNLVVQNDVQPEGAVKGTAWMEKDGLHAEIVNGTDIALENAVLVTSLGYADIGAIGAAETVQVSIAKAEQITKNVDGDQAILAGELLAFPVSLSTVSWAAIYPQTQTDAEFAIDEQGEHHAQWLKRLKLNLASAGMDGAFACVLCADTPQIACAQLYKDGKAIERSAQESILTAELTFESVGKTGVFYYPQGTFDVHDVSLVSGTPALGKLTQKRYADLGNDAVYGFDLSGIDHQRITAIRISSEYYKPERALLTLEVYDFAAGDWMTLRAVDRIELDSTLTGRVISAEGHLFIRYTSDNGDACTVYLPSIIVEGGAQA